jgi:hypothetical protein
MIGIYYGNGWNAKSLPFMSTRLLTTNGTAYPLDSVFPGGVLDEGAMAEHGLPSLTGTFAFAMFMANAAIGALIVHCILFWGKDIWKTYKSAREGRFDDRHHVHMAKHYKETPWWWFIVVLVGSFVIGIIVTTTQNITLPVWAYVVSLLIGSIIAPFVSESIFETDTGETPLIIIEHHSLLSLRQWYCYKQSVKDDRRTAASWTPSR